jgi:L-lactate dehydrogenase (cytochrome)
VVTRTRSPTEDHWQGEISTVVEPPRVRSSADVAASATAGADAAFIRRPYFWGLAAGGKRGVDHVISILTDELHRTTQLLGAESVSALSAHGMELIGRSK